MGTPAVPLTGVAAGLTLAWVALRFSGRGELIERRTLDAPELIYRPAPHV